MPPPERALALATRRDARRDRTRAAPLRRIDHLVGGLGAGSSCEGASTRRTLALPVRPKLAGCTPRGASASAVAVRARRGCCAHAPEQRLSGRQTRPRKVWRRPSSYNAGWV
eukprot:355105-Chlamydomonas_euryale.AAC.5